MGLSPRVRGNRISPQDGGNDEGSIPACTGEPPALATTSKLPWVYPRVYGGTKILLDYAKRGGGLSPRVRGNLGIRGHGCPSCGSIPACTGEPVERSQTRPLGRVYPRVYGGTSIEERTALESEGLSPRVRGNLLPRDRRRLRMRSIPACTGEPKFHDLLLMRPPCATGLSPRVRGNHYQRRRGSRKVRSIPACTGEPEPAPLLTGIFAVYPRVYGGTS